MFNLRALPPNVISSIAEHIGSDPDGRDALHTLLDDDNLRKVLVTPRLNNRVRNAWSLRRGLNEGRDIWSVWQPFVRQQPGRHNLTEYEQNLVCDPTIGNAFSSNRP